MSEQFDKENVPSSENQEDKENALQEEGRLYNEYKIAEDEVGQIIAEMDNVFESIPDRGEAEKIILEKWVPLMDEALEKSRELLTQWLEAMNNS